MLNGQLAYTKGAGEYSWEDCTEAKHYHRETEPSRHNVPSEQSLYVDIMLINYVPFLLSVSKLLNLLQVADVTLTSRNSSTIRVGMENHIRTQESHGYKVMSDGEGAISAIADIMALRGVSFNPTGPGQHVPTVERKIRQIKEHCRCIMNTLPYTLPIKWIF